MPADAWLEVSAPTLHCLQQLYTCQEGLEFVCWASSCIAVGQPIAATTAGMVAMTSAGLLAAFLPYNSRDGTCHATLQPYFSTWACSPTTHTAFLSF
jgi:hypothetical protein